MNDIIAADIFFFITTCAVIIITVAIALVAFHIYRIVKKVEVLADRVTVGFSTFEEFIKKAPFLKGILKIKRSLKRTRKDE